MARIDDYTIRRIKETAKIYDVVSDFIQLRKSGVRYTGLCPFHQDRHMGNFVVYPKKNVFKCFACDAKGGPIEFIMKHEGLEFLDAIRYLGRKYNSTTHLHHHGHSPHRCRCWCCPTGWCATPHNPTSWHRMTL